MRHDLETGIAIAIDDSSQIGEARRSAGAIAAASGLSATEAGRFAIIATEAATNIAKHAARGEIMLRSVVGQGIRAVDLVAIDSGPGIPDLDRALSDGYSTAGSPGHGLGAMARLATRLRHFHESRDRHRIDRAHRGTMARPRSLATRSRWEQCECRSAVSPSAATDWGIVVDEDGRATLTVADGLGHGLSAAEASRRAVRARGRARRRFDRQPSSRPSTQVSAAREAPPLPLRSSTPTDGRVRFCRAWQHCGGCRRPAQFAKSRVAQRDCRARDAQDSGVRVPLAARCLARPPLRWGQPAMGPRAIPGARTAPCERRCWRVVSRLLTRAR